jgi:hypothetical protein
MHHRVEWGNDEQTVILQTYFDQTSTADQMEVAQESKRLAESVPHTVHIIIDGRKGNQIPNIRVSHLAPLAEMTVPTNQGIVVCVGFSDFIKGLVNIARLIAPRAAGNVRFVRTVDQAWALLKEEAGVEPPSPPTA